MRNHPHGEEPLVTILITHRRREADFIENSLFVLSQLTKHPYKVAIRDNGSSIAAFERLKEVVARYRNAEIVERIEENNIANNDVSHATSLNALVKHVDTPYFSILDADATWLAYHWDDILMRKMSDTVKAAGTQAPSWKPQGFPLPFAIFLETKTFQKLDIDFMPLDIQAGKGTAYQLREKYLSAGYEGIVLEVRNTDEYKKGPFSEIIGVEEYYFPGSEEIVAAHFSRGSKTLGVGRYKKGWKRHIYKIPKLGYWLLKRKRKKDEERWIQICQKIVKQRSQKRL